MCILSGHKYSVFAQIMSGDELSDMHNDDRRAEPSLTQMLQALLADREEERQWERVCLHMDKNWLSPRKSGKYS